MLVPFIDLKQRYQEEKSEILESIDKVLSQGHLIMTQEVNEFEEMAANYIGVKHVIGLNSGTDALMMALWGFGIGKGDEVIVPAHGYIATWLAVTHVGATPIPCECSESTYNLDPLKVQRLISANTKAILPIDLYGQTANYPELRKAIEGKNIFILEDAAQSHGAKCGDISAGNLGDAAGISFYPSKNLGAFSDAGAITTNDSLLADAVRMLRNYGSKERYKNEVIGINSRLSELQSAFLRVKLTRLNEWNLRRKILAAIYFDHLNNVGDIILPHVPSWADPVWHLFVIRTKKRDALRNYLLEKGVGTQIHYPIPPHLSDAYTSLGYKKGDFPLAELLADEVLSLPIGPHTLASEIEFVCASIQNFFSHGN